MNDLEIISLTKLELKAAIAENRFWNGTFQPAFSKNKAQWMVENNHATDDDMLALLGYEKHELVAFVGFVPDLIRTDTNAHKKIFWSLRWWVADKYEGNILSTYILNEGFNKVDNQVVIKFLGPNTEKFYSKRPFTKFSERERFIILYSLNYNLLTDKIKGLKNIAPVIKFLDKMSFAITTSINKSKNKKRLKEITYQTVDTINLELWGFIEEHSKKDLVPKSQAYVNWQIDNGQYTVLDDVSEKDQCLLYSASKRIFNVSFCVRKNGEIIGFVSCLVNKSKFIVRYFLTSEVNFEICFEVLMKSFFDSECTMIQTVNTALGELMQQRYFNIYSDKKQLFALAHNALGFDITESEVFDQDGNFF